MSSCAVCYEPFGSGDSSYTPRRLPCSHVVCTQCLEDCFEDAGARRGPDEKVSVNTPNNVEPPGVLRAIGAWG
jgi:hypothetical protein